MKSSGTAGFDVVASTLEYRIDDLGKIGAQPDGGVTRTAFDPNWRRAQATISEWMDSIGLETRYDAVGNLFGRWAGRDERSGTILTGSHVDTVHNGGKYDGALGILGALSAIESLMASGESPRKSIEVVAICEEEGSRFPGQFLGSRSMLGLIDESEGALPSDAEGVSLDRMLADIGSPGLSAVGSGKRTDIERFVELHVEQGPFLEEAGCDVGIVTGIAGLRHQVFTVSGQQDHAGATPMDRRRDALQAAAEMSRAIDAIVREAGHPLVGTIGSFTTGDNSANTIAGEVEFSLDLRHPSDSFRLGILDDIVAACHGIAARNNVSVRTAVRWEEAATDMDAGLQEMLSDGADSRGLTTMSLPSGAAHDSQLWARHVPTAMIFVPSIGGRSHCPEEATRIADCVRGAELLAQSLHRLAF